VDEFDERGSIEAAELEERGLMEEDAETVERDLKSGKGRKDNWKYKKNHKKYYHEKKKPVCEFIKRDNS
jgi:adenylate kinase family enzyme